MALCLRACLHAWVEVKKPPFFPMLQVTDFGKLAAVVGEYLTDMNAGRQGCV